MQHVPRMPVRALSFELDGRAEKKTSPYSGLVAPAVESHSERRGPQCGTP